MSYVKWKICASNRKPLNGRAIAEAALPQAVEACEIIKCALSKQIGDVAALMAVINDPAAIQLLCDEEK